MNLLLVRHGETALNVARVLQPADTPLSARGRAQADAVARRLGALRVLRIVSSDLPRAQHTAQAIAAATGAPLEHTPLLQERNFGDWRGLPYDRLALDPLNHDAAPPHGESLDAFHARVAAAWAHVTSLARMAAAATLTASPDGAPPHRDTHRDMHPGTLADTLAEPPCLVVVTHGLVLGAMLARHVRLDERAAGAALPAQLRNTGVSIVEAHAPHRVLRVDCVRHLEAPLHIDARGLSGG